MALFKRRRGYDPIKEFGPKEEERRRKEIPTFRDVRGFRESGWRSLLHFDEEIFTFTEGNKKPIPASIEYFSDRRSGDSSSDEDIKREMPNLDELLSKQISSNPRPQKDEGEDRIEEKTVEEIAAQYKDQEIVDFSKASLAEEEEIARLEKKHMDFYSILSKIQDTHVASDFKAAYDIQDRISYLLNHRTLLYKSLVSQLLIYLDSIIAKMEKYHEDMSEKQKKFNRYNRKVSELQKYKFKTDESIKIINRSQEVVHSEMEIQKKNAEETP